MIWLFFIQAFIGKSVIELQSMFFGPPQLGFPFDEHFLCLDDLACEDMSKVSLSSLSHIKSDIW